MSISDFLINRSLGLSNAKDAMESKIIASHMAQDHFHSETIELPKGSGGRMFRGHNFVAVYSDHHLALWSLITKSKLWDFEIHPKNRYWPDRNSCTLSEYGMVLIDSETIVLDGEQTGVLPQLHWYSVVAIGLRILGCWAERHNPDEPEPSWYTHFFGEYDQTGRPLDLYQLDNTRGRWTHTYTCNDNFWVRLSGSDKAALSSIIEVVDRLAGKMRTYELPLNIEEETIPSACIVQNRLFYGKNIVKFQGNYNFKAAIKPTICIFDLVKGAIVEEFSTGAEKGELRNLVATQHYVAWLEYRGEKDLVKYLDIFNKTVSVATIAPFCREAPEVNLNIVGTILSVTSATGGENTKCWRRQVIDMTNGTIKCDVKYKRISQDGCSVANEMMLITDTLNTPNKMYIERFIGVGRPDQKSDVRIRQAS